MKVNTSKLFPDWIKNQLPEGTESNYFKSSLAKLHYLTRGHGHKVILLHGNPTWSFLWRKVMNELDQSAFNVIAPDLLNLGFSDSLAKDDFNMENHVLALTEFFEKIDINNATVVVQDWGGPIGLAALARCKVKIKGLIILNTGVAAPKAPYRISKFHSFVNKRILPDLLFNICGYPMYSLHKVQHDKSSITGEVAKAYRYPMRQDKSKWASALRFARMVPNSDSHPSYGLFKEVEKFCREFEGPVEAVWGTKDPILGRGLKKVVAVFKGISVEEVEAGHFLQEECFVSIAEAIKRIAKEKL